MTARVLVGVVGVSLALCSFVFAQSVDPALREAIAGRDKASMTRDVAGVDRYTADDYAAVNPQGVLNNKTQRLAGLKTPVNPQSPPAQLAVQESVRVYGSAAVSRQKASNNRQLLVWRKGPAGWQALTVHVVPDASPAPAAQMPPPRSPMPSTLAVPAGLSGEQAAIFAVFKQMQDAFFAGDAATYAKFTAPEFIRLAPGGVVREGATPVDAPRPQPTYSNITVVALDQLGFVRWLETNAGGRQQWLTRVLAKKGNGWQQIATASSIAGKPPVAP